MNLTSTHPKAHCRYLQFQTWTFCFKTLGLFIFCETHTTPTQFVPLPLSQVISLRNLKFLDSNYNVRTLMAGGKTRICPTLPSRVTIICHQCSDPVASIPTWFECSIFKIITFQTHKLKYSCATRPPLAEPSLATFHRHPHTAVCTPTIKFKGSRFK